MPNNKDKIELINAILKGEIKIFNRKEEDIETDILKMGYNLDEYRNLKMSEIHS